MSTSPPVFDRWASVYDTQLNPLIALEQRILPTVVPAVCGADVLDVGCGTGRWLKHLEGLHPASLTGIDPSAMMLDRARAKLIPETILKLGDATRLPVNDASLDLILASFVLSYITDLPLFASECARVIRQDGHILISDMHPVTSQERGWTRSFQTEGALESLLAITRSLQHIVSVFEQQGFNLCQLEEPSFEAPERPLFEQTHKLAAFEDLGGVPAIYVLRFAKQAFQSGRTLTRRPSDPDVAPPTLLLAGALWSAGPETWISKPLSIHNGRVSLASHTSPTIDLSDYVLLPGLINAHDHLDFALFPNLGRTLPYDDAAAWARDIHQQHAATIKQHLEISLETRLWWGAIRNLLCGVTTVCHHNPAPSKAFLEQLPIRLVEHFGWAHSLTFDQNLSDRFSATPPDQPFILHAAEGINQPSCDEITILDRMNLLDARTVLIHGLACTSAEIALLNARGAGLVLCPTSNLFLFDRTLSNTLINAIGHAALGSDSPLTARGDLLDEINYLHVKQRLSANTLYNLVTRNPARLLRLNEERGRILPGAPADLVAVKDRRCSPAETLASLSFADIELVFLAGQVQLASSTLYSRLPTGLRAGLHLLTVEGHQRWIRAPLPELFSAGEAVLGEGNLRVGGKEVHHLAAR